MTNSQKMAQAAWGRIEARKPGKEYRSIARGFPSLVHSCGLAQAVAFARSKKDMHGLYLEDLSSVLAAIGFAGELDQAARECSVSEYIRLSRSALQAAGWLKRYTEATYQEEKNAPGA